MKNEQRLLPNYPLLVVKTVSKTVIFQKILDGDPTKIVKMSRKSDQHGVIAEKH